MRKFGLCILMGVVCLVWGNGALMAADDSVLHADIAEVTDSVYSPVSLPYASDIAYPYYSQSLRPFVDSSSILLYDNGPFITHAGIGPNGEDFSVADTDLGFITYGYSFSTASVTRLADDFTIPPGDPWIITSITVYGYQTGSSTQSTFYTANVRIWDNDPREAEANIVFGNVYDNFMLTSAFVNVYRSITSTMLNTTRPIMGIVLSTPVTLPPGTYWLDVQTGGTIASGPWGVPICLSGQAETGNALQYSGGVWNDLIETGTSAQQGVPFHIHGIPEPTCGLLLCSAALIVWRRIRA